jgi:hypothetical protein
MRDEQEAHLPLGVVDEQIFDSADVFTVAVDDFTPAHVLVAGRDGLAGLA